MMTMHTLTWLSDCLGMGSQYLLGQVLRDLWNKEAARILCHTMFCFANDGQHVYLPTCAKQAVLLYRYKMVPDNVAVSN